MRGVVPEGDWRDPSINWAITERAARADAARHMRAILPDPAVEATYLPLHLVEALVGAVNRGHHGWVVANIHAAELRSIGMVAFGRGMDGRGITAFGWAVRKALLADVQ